MRPRNRTRSETSRLRASARLAARGGASPATGWAGAGRKADGSTSGRKRRSSTALGTTRGLYRNTVRLVIAYVRVVTITRSARRRGGGPELPGRDPPAGG